jgi:hypothetical protein
LKKIDLKIKFAIAVSVLIFTLGAVTNLLFMPVALGYMASVILAYYFGSKIDDAALVVGYIWFSKWTLFMIFLLITGTNIPETFLHAMSLFIVFNISLNPAVFMLNKEPSK